MTKFSKGEFVPVNPQKYIGKIPIVFRSSWEFSCMRLFDSHPNIINWASESLNIPYQNPLTGRWTMYVPDFLVVYQDRMGKRHGEVIEVKPMKEALMEHARTRRDKLVNAINKAKFASATGWCHKHHLSFRVLTEKEIFGHTKRKLN